MSNCPNSLPSNSFKKVYSDGLVFVKCEYCNATFEDTTTRTMREVSESMRNEVQNKAPSEEDIRWNIHLGIVVLTLFGGIIEAILWNDQSYTMLRLKIY